LIQSLLSYVRVPTKTLAIIGLTLASTIMVAGLAVWAWYDFSDVLADAETINRSTAMAMDTVARSSLQAVDGVLESMVGRIDRDGIASLAAEPGKQALERYARRLPRPGAIFVADSTGKVVAAVPSLRTPTNVSDRAWFRNLKEEKIQPEGVQPFRSFPYVGRALREDTAGNLFFPVARAIRGPGGAFIGAVQVGVEVAYFADVFHALDYGFSSLDVRSEAKLGIYRKNDGSVVAAFPITEALLGETVVASPYFSLLASSEGQSWTGWTRDGGERHLVSARSLRGWPLVVSVSLPESEVYSVAWTRLLWRSIVAAMTIAALSLIAMLANRQARREAVLTAELTHRVKNTLAVVASVIERAREDTKSIDDFVSSLQSRIQSMAETQTLLSQSRGRGVSLADLVRTELRPYATGTNTSVDGPRVYLLPAASHALAMVLHELATNAAKYGALSQPGGHVSVRWRRPDDLSSAPMLRIEWKETGGPEVVAPAREGYGSNVIRDVLAYEMGSRVHLVFEPDGVRCTIELPTNAQTVV
jgi:two-component sensor histidine kinase